MGVRQEDIDRAIAAGNKVLAKLREVCPVPKGFPKNVNECAMSTDKTSHLMPKKRIRQSAKPLLNKLETEWLQELERRHGPGKARVQAKKYKLANGCWYCPDFTITTRMYAEDLTWETAYEVKGKHAWDDALVKLKVAAHQWPEIRFVLVWKQDGHWMEQVVLP